MRAIVLSLALLCISPITAFAQITFEHEYPVISDTMSGPILITIGPNEQKYLVHEWSQGSFSLYNLDHTLFLGSVHPSIPLYQPPISYEPIYISRSLFDCDSTNIEFAIATVSLDTGIQFTVMRTDGTVLFSENNATVPYCVGCELGSVVIQGINNTQAGTKLTLMIWSGVPGHYRYRVYSVCGALPLGLHGPTPQAQSVVYPNPSSEAITIDIPEEAPMGINRLDLMTMNGQMVMQRTFSGQTIRLAPDQLREAGSIYFYRIITASGRVYSGRINRQR